MSRIPAMPITMVRKITGAMIIFTSFTNPSPSGFRYSAIQGSPRQKWPISPPTRIAVRTWKYSWV